jgi:hypothetical protein
MAIHYMASIRAGHYPAFQSLLSGELPLTYEAWELAHERDTARIITADTDSPQVVDVAVEPGPFEAWCKEAERSLTAASLEEYARHLAALKG